MNNGLTLYGNISASQIFRATVQGENFLVRQLDHIGFRFFDLVSKYIFCVRLIVCFRVLIFFLIAYDYPSGTKVNQHFSVAGVVSLRAMPAPLI